jgi:deoxyribodipyrimidine photolyase-related protein
MKTLKLILGDQLNINHSWYKTLDDSNIFVMMELLEEMQYVKHHIQKIAAFLLAMRQFAEKLRNMGHRLIYLELDNPLNTGYLGKNLTLLVKHYPIDHFEYQKPDEYRVLKNIQKWIAEQKISFRQYSTEHFLTTPEEFKQLFNGKPYLMENFYRYMRKKTGILMQGSKPVGNQWNYDYQNRKKYDFQTSIPPVEKWVEPELTKIIQLLKSKKIKTIGCISPPEFIWPTTREKSLLILKNFIDYKLPYFGKYQDSLFSDNDFLFHSRLSFSLNTKLIHPMDVILAVQNAWINNPQNYPLNSVEGFIRQLLGWREYMHNIYWIHMPDYEKCNYFNHANNLPSWFWTGKTKMKCLEHAISQSLKHAYAHHIQRLMVTGNFLLLIQCHPDEVDNWYLGIYIDAIQWVEITNTRGMSQFADGGLIATKPYISSANYIHKMSNYCNSCIYDHQKKYGNTACPFNSLYWNFLFVNYEKLKNNMRLKTAFMQMNKMNPLEKEKISKQAHFFMKNVEIL